MLAPVLVCFPPSQQAAALIQLHCRVSAFLVIKKIKGCDGKLSKFDSEHKGV